VKQIQRSAGVLAAGLAIAMGWMGRDLVGQTPASALADEFQRDAYPVLAGNCVVCHNDRLQTANLSFEALQDPAQAVKSTAARMEIRRRDTSHCSRWPAVCTVLPPGG